MAYNGNTEAAMHRLETTGQPVALRLEADNPQWQADGLDLQHVRIYAVDKRGRRVYGTAGTLRFAVEGNGRIVAMSNGDNTCDHINTPVSPDCGEYPMHDGAALVILRSGRDTGDGKVRLTASMDIGGKTLEKTVSLPQVR